MTDMIFLPLPIQIFGFSSSMAQLEILSALILGMFLDGFPRRVSNESRFDFCQNTQSVQSKCLEVLNNNIVQRWLVITGIPIVSYCGISIRGYERTSLGENGT